MLYATTFWVHLGGGHLYFRLDIILIKGLSKHILNMYFFRYENRPYIHVFSYFFFWIFLNLSIKSFPKFVNMTKNTPFFQFCTYIKCLVLKNNPNYMIFFFLRGWYPTSNTRGPPPYFLMCILKRSTNITLILHWVIQSLLSLES